MPGASEWGEARRLLNALTCRVEIAEASLDRAAGEVVKLNNLYRTTLRDAEHYENVKICYEHILQNLFAAAGVLDAGALEQRLIEHMEMLSLARRLDLPGEGNPLPERFELHIARLILERNDAVTQLEKIALNNEVNP